MQSVEWESCWLNHYLLHPSEHSHSSYDIWQGTPNLHNSLEVARATAVEKLPHIHFGTLDEINFKLLLLLKDAAVSTCHQSISIHGSAPLTTRSARLVHFSQQMQGAQATQQAPPGRYKIQGTLAENAFTERSKNDLRILESPLLNVHRIRHRKCL